MENPAVVCFLFLAIFLFWNCKSSKYPKTSGL